MQRKAKILFVDDEVRIVRLLHMMFNASHHVYTATSGRDALQIIQDERIDVIVSDYRMPGMLGSELLAEVRQRSPSTLRLLLTGYTDLSAVVGAVNEGEVHRFLYKPWDQQEMRAIVEECAQRAIAASAAVSTEAVQTTVDRHVPTTAVRLLVFEGEHSDRKEMIDLLARDHEVFSASNTEEALDVLKRHDVGVIVADCHVNGEETSELLRSHKQNHPAVSIVMVCSTTDSSTVVKLVNETKIHRFLTKPINHELFGEAVRAAVRERFRLLAATQQNPDT